MASAAIRCGCCKDLIKNGKAPLDPELKVPVCEECHDLLVRVQRILGRAGLVGCTRDYADGSNG